MMQEVNHFIANVHVAVDSWSTSLARLQLACPLLLPPMTQGARRETQGGGGLGGAQLLRTSQRATPRLMLSRAPMALCMPPGTATGVPQLAGS